VVFAAVKSAHAASSFEPFTYEIEPVLGLNLPYDFWGTQGTLSMFGLRMAYAINEKSAIESGIFAQHADPDRIYTFDVSYRYELETDVLNPFFNFGLHYSRVNFTVDHDSTGACIPANCQTDSGNKIGVLVGAGLQIPINSKLPLKLSMRFYKEPVLWLLLEAGLGFRF
jgi:opacity protein-like surface antigen